MKHQKSGEQEMPNKDSSSTNQPYSIDLTRIEGDGSFPCPKCGTVISPDDESEEVYKILNTKVINDQLVELIVECNNCKRSITLTGFETTIEGLTSK
jgi:predicted RNA-binding Zn-ribbon protein involved in translation (DUF1610 family)